MAAMPDTLCARCAVQGKTCCLGREIYLTPGDVRRISGDFIFLTPERCRLRLETRPLVRRWHPFTFTADHIDSEPDAGCPRHLLASGESVFEAIQMSTTLAQQWHRQLYKEVQTDDHDHRPDVRPAL